jgi:ABC-type branched-subunit amino acid transport system substrate-binding protein
MFQDAEYGKNVLDGFTQQLAAMKIKSGTETSYKRGVSDFSAQVARMKADGCDLVMLGTVIRETIGAMTEARKIGWTVEFLGAGPTNVIEVPLLGKDAVEGLYAAALFEIPYEDTAQGKVKEWLANYKKMFGIAANTQAIIGYNAIETFAFYANLAGRDLTGQSLLAALESGKEFHDIFGSPPVKFSPTNHLASAETMIQQIQNGRWKVIQVPSPSEHRHNGCNAPFVSGGDTSHLEVQRAGRNRADRGLCKYRRKLGDRVLPCVAFVPRILFGHDVLSLKTFVRPPRLTVSVQIDGFGKKLVAVIR